MANNNEIILSALIEQGVMEPWEIERCLEAGKMPEYHTYKAWQAKGYAVKKGEHAAIKCELWNYTERPTKADRIAIEAGELPEGYKHPHYYLKAAALFGPEQVEKIEDKGKVKRKAKSRKA